MIDADSCLTCLHSEPRHRAEPRNRAEPGNRAEPRYRAFGSCLEDKCLCESFVSPTPTPTISGAYQVAIQTVPVKNLNSQSVLMESEHIVHGDRHRDYGHPLDDFSKTAGMWSSIFAEKLNSPFTAEDVALAMICVKLSREIHRHKRDNLVDIAGYSETANMCAEERSRRAAL